MGDLVIGRIGEHVQQIVEVGIEPEPEDVTILRLSLAGKIVQSLT